MATFDYSGNESFAGYLNTERLLDRMFALKNFVPGFMEYLRWPSKLPKNRDEIVSALEKQLTHLTVTDRKYHNLNIAHVLVFELYRHLEHSERELYGVFLSTREESAMKIPFKTQFLAENKECASFKFEVDIGKSRADGFAVMKRPGIMFGIGAREDYVAFELKARYGEVRHALEQISDYQNACEETYLVATPLLTIEYAWKSAPKANDPIDPFCLESKLKSTGSGLYILYTKEKTDQTINLHLRSGSKVRFSEKGKATLAELLRGK